jgi:hypothetical protein
MIMPGTVGDSWFYRRLEIASILFFSWLFIYVVFTALSNLRASKEIRLLRRPTFSLLIFKEKTDDKFVSNYSFSFIGCCFMANYFRKSSFTYRLDLAWIMIATDNDNNVQVV